MFDGCDITLTRLGLTQKDVDQLGIADEPQVDALDDEEMVKRLENAVEEVI